jgi:hypothetical protein
LVSQTINVKSSKIANRLLGLFVNQATKLGCTITIHHLCEVYLERIGVKVIGTLNLNTRHIPLLAKSKKLAAAECNGIMVMKWRDKTECHS